MTRYPKTNRYTQVLAILALCIVALSARAAPAHWQDDLQPIAAGDWSQERAAHWLERAGFGGTPAEVARLAAMSSRQAVQTLVRYQRIANPLPPFDPSGVHDAGLEPFASSRPAATNQARIHAGHGAHRPRRRFEGAGVFRVWPARSARTRVWAPTMARPTLCT